MDIKRILEKINSSVKKKKTVAEYIELSNTWEANFILLINDKLEKSESREKLALFIALISVIGALYMAVNQNHYIQIEEIDVKTGYRKIRDIYEVGKPLTIDQQELFLRADVTRFIGCYEGYSLSQRQENLSCVGAFSNSKVTKQYTKYVHLDNLSGPASIIKELGLIKVKVVDITTFEHDKGTVIAHVVTKAESDKEYKPNYMNITINFEYKNIPSDSKIRDMNPHGFMAKSYYSNPQGK